MAVIAPFRHLIVYPPMLREIGRRWRALPGERVRRVRLPPSARALSMFSRIDYHDAFLVETGPDHDRTAEQWARAMLERAPVSRRNALARGWSMLGLRLGSARSDHCVLGWEIRRATPDAVLLGARGRLGLSGELEYSSHLAGGAPAGSPVAIRRSQVQGVSQ
jgi:hypothetical protein